MTSQTITTESNNTLFYILIGVLGVLALTFGILWGMQFFGTNYKKKARSLQTEVDTLKSEAQKLRQVNAVLGEQLGQPLEVGFEVQIAAFERYDIRATNEEMLRMAEIEAEGLNKYVLGRFSNFEDAENFVSDVRAMGLTDAFIAGVVNGERSTVEEAKAASKAYYGY